MTQGRKSTLGDFSGSLAACPERDGNRERAAMKRTILLVLLMACGAGTPLVADSDTILEFDKPFQSHQPDGRSYWVVLCVQGDQCYEDAYKWCHGPYTPLDKHSYLKAASDSCATNHVKNQPNRTSLNRPLA